MLFEQELIDRLRFDVRKKYLGLPVYQDGNLTQPILLNTRNLEVTKYHSRLSLFTAAVLTEFVYIRVAEMAGFKPLKECLEDRNERNNNGLRKDYIRHGFHIAIANKLDSEIYQYLIDKCVALPHYDAKTHRTYSVEELEVMGIMEVWRDSDWKASIS
jgi:hypothetical protein